MTRPCTFEFLPRHDSHPLLLEQRRYIAKLTAPNFTFAIGDQVWLLSRLTEAGHYGLGVGGSAEWKNLFTEAFVDTGRRDQGREPLQIGGLAGVRLGGVARVTGQYLVRGSTTSPSRRESELVSARFRVDPRTGWRGELEVGSGSSPTGGGTAASGELSYTSSPLSFYARRARMSAGYPMRDRTGVVDAVTVSARPGREFVLDAAFNGTEEDDPRLPAGAPTRRRESQAAIAWNRSFGVGVRRSEWTTSDREWSAGWRREAVEARFGVPFGPIRVTPGMDRGRE